MGQRYGLVTILCDFLHGYLHIILYICTGISDIKEQNSKKYTWSYNLKIWCA